MDKSIFYKRQQKFGQKLKQLHHWNALFFTFLALTGLLLVSSDFRQWLPQVRIWVKDSHIWIGFISLLPLLFYTPKMVKHLKTLRKRKNNRTNLYVVLSILGALIVSGILLTFQRELNPGLSSFALIVHDIMTWVGVPYLIYHSITRSQWFKAIEKRRAEEKENKRMVIEDSNPIMNRRTFLRRGTGAGIVIVFSPFIYQWAKPYLNLPSGPPPPSEMPLTEAFSPLPTPAPKSKPPIGGGRTGEFRYYTVTQMPTITDDNFSFTIDGLVDQVQEWDWESFVGINRGVQVANFYCVTGWSVFDVTWEGIKLSDLLKRAGVKDKATHVKFYSQDGVYTDSLTLDQAMDDDVMVAMLIDGELIPNRNGGPVRLIVPRMYAYKSVKWLNRIELIDEEHIGYWQQRGYGQDAWVKL
ncbi:molybdopterin-dependent oxidoreductase [Halobacillus litoralis]|uniref:molybdopterin-dependent oxidoreductase n=1 Tax=Halobacillus litoralis TaxID=45668 RepID=UPI001CD5BB75|nr:molybdopterin-dependent oxidoreductase [Halobacillus litoralis]MCA0972518.1 molybdopterin-dependent oxidoreductase [Halobacillus litoralis]